jgi:hypothetical protein
MSKRLLRLGFASYQGAFGASNINKHNEWQTYVVVPVCRYPHMSKRLLRLGFASYQGAFGASNCCFFFLFFFFWKGFCLIFSFIVCKVFRFLFYSLERFPFSLLLSVKISVFSFILWKDFRFLFYSLERFPFSLLFSVKISVSSSAGTRPKGCEVHPRRKDEYRFCRKSSTVLCFSFDLSGKNFRFL